MKFFSSTKPVHEVLEKWLFFQMPKSQQNITKQSKKKKKTRKRWLIERNEISRNQPKEMQASDLPDFKFFKNNLKQLLKDIQWDFPGGAVDNNLPANSGDTGSIPGPGRCHMLQSNWASEPQPLSPCSRACKPQPVSPCATTTEARLSRACAPQQEKPLQ